MNCSINSARHFSGLQAGMSPISLVHLAGSVRKFNLNRPFILPILDDARQCLQDYALRWRIEDWHRALKSGCKIEKLAHQCVDRLERALAINMVIAWHIMVMTLLGREVPELPAEALFSDLEIEVLQAYSKASLWWSG